MKTLNEFIAYESNNELVSILEDFFNSVKPCTEEQITESFNQEFICESPEEDGGADWHGPTTNKPKEKEAAKTEPDDAARALAQTFNNSKGGLGMLAKQAQVDRQQLQTVVDKICRKVYVTDNISQDGAEVDAKKLERAKKVQTKNLEALMSDQQAIIGLSAILCGAILMNDSTAKGSKKVMVKLMESLAQIITKQKKNIGKFLGLRK